ncbi:MAG: methyltransferase domain-containing protein [Candidatus Bathyarchaeota archaeon]|nr:MAG: methyltransferase domain-containing protein [Candidatus Bathyarchaeota archaeon]
MKPEEDAVGQAIWAFHRGNKSFEVIEREDGYIDVTNPRLYFTEFNAWMADEKKAMDYVKGKVLDVGCGAGRHSLYLQKRGLQVLGIDQSPLAIKMCRQRGLKNAKIMPIRGINFKPNSFDTIIMMGNNFALLGDFENARRILKKFHKISSENGLIIASAVDVYPPTKDAQEHLAYFDFNTKRGRMAGQWKVRIRFRKFATTWFDLLHVSKKEMGEILVGTGWRIKEFIDPNSVHYVAIMEKV